jgi:hypothetical protein
MTYPPAPWHLQGDAILTLHLVEIDRARRFVPPELDIVAVLPGKTLGSVYFSDYQPGSVLEYNELIVAPALVQHRGRVGGWISHIYVDCLASVAGGREIWGLPKEVAQFVRSDRGVTIQQHDLTLCTLNYRSSWFSSFSLQPKITGYCFGNLNSDLLYFANDFQGELSWIDGMLSIPSASPFAGLNLFKPLLTLRLKKLDLTANLPDVVGTKIKDWSII